MSDDLLAWLAIAAGRVEGFEFSEHPGHEGTLCGEAHDEIERLRALIAAWADADDKWDDLHLGEWRRDCTCNYCVAVDALRKAIGR